MMPVSWYFIVKVPWGPSKWSLYAKVIIGRGLKLLDSCKCLTLWNILYYIFFHSDKILVLSQLAAFKTLVISLWQQFTISESTPPQNFFTIFKVKAMDMTWNMMAFY